MTWEAIAGRADAWNVDPRTTTLNRTGVDRVQATSITARLIDPEGEPIGVTVWPRNESLGVSV